jgi:hypothetical protein
MILETHLLDFDRGHCVRMLVKCDWGLRDESRRDEHDKMQRDARLSDQKANLRFETCVKGNECYTTGVSDCAGGKRVMCWQVLTIKK